MAFTNFGYFNSASAGAPALRPVNGDLNALIDYALTTISNWTRPYHDGTNFRDVWQPAAGGPVFICKHNSTDSGDARLAVVRLAESATSTTSYTDPFPTATQVADTSANWLVSNTSGTTARDYHCVVWETGFLLSVRCSGQTDVWETMGFGKAFSRFSSTDDPYPWMIGVRNSSNTSSVGLVFGSGCGTNSTIPSSGTYRFFAMRNAAGTIKSSVLQADGRGSTIGSVGGSPSSAGAGYLLAFEREKIRFHDMGNSTTSAPVSPILSRLCFPQIYAGAHVLYVGVSESDNIDDGSHTLQLLRNNTANAVVMETSNLFTGYPAG